MKIEVRKFGKILNGRPAGREGGLVLKQMLRETKEDATIILDFADVLVLTPSYADEFLRPLQSSDYTIQIDSASQPIKDTLNAIEFSPDESGKPN